MRWLLSPLVEVIPLFTNNDGSWSNNFCHYILVLRIYFNFTPIRKTEKPHQTLFENRLEPHRPAYGNIPIVSLLMTSWVRFGRSVCISLLSQWIHYTFAPGMNKECIYRYIELKKHCKKKILECSRSSRVCFGCEIRNEIVEYECTRHPSNM